MQADELRRLVTEVQQRRMEPDAVEVKAANHPNDTPKVTDSLSAFANLPGGGVILLAYLRQHDRITNADYRRLNRVEAAVAGQELRGLVDAGLVEQDGVGRWTTYSLKVARELPEQLAPETEEDRIMAAAREKGSITNSECQTLLGVGENRAYYLLKKLAEAGRLKPQGKGKGRKYLPT